MTDEEAEANGQYIEDRLLTITATRGVGADRAIAEALDVYATILQARRGNIISIATDPPKFLLALPGQNQRVLNLRFLRVTILTSFIGLCLGIAGSELFDSGRPWHAAVLCLAALAAWWSWWTVADLLRTSNPGKD